MFQSLLPAKTVPTGAAQWDECLRKAEHWVRLLLLLSRRCGSCAAERAFVGTWSDTGRD